MGTQYRSARITGRLNLGRFIVHFIIGLFGGMVAIYAPKLLSIGSSAFVNLDANFVQALFNPTFFLIALILAAIVAVIVALKEYGENRHPYQIFLSALVIPTMLSSMLGYSLESASHTQAIQELKHFKEKQNEKQNEISPSELKPVIWHEESGFNQPNRQTSSWGLLPARAWAQDNTGANSLESCLTHATIKFELRNFSVQSTQSSDPENFAVILEFQATLEEARKRAKALSAQMNIQVAPFQKQNQFILIACGDLMTEMEAKAKAATWNKEFGLHPEIFRLKNNS